MAPPPRAAAAGARQAALGGNFRFPAAPPPRGADGPSGLDHHVLRLSRQDIEDLKRTVATEWNKHDMDQGQGIIDTILNRQASGKWGRTIREVVNSRKQFSDVNGPVAWKQHRYSVDQVPASRVDRATSALVDQYLAQRAAGRASIVGNNLNYANPYGSDARNLVWINALDGPVFGHGRSIHRHGTVPQWQRYRPAPYRIALPSD